MGEERETIDKGREIRKKEKEMKKDEKRKGWRNVIGRIVKRGKSRRRKENVLKRKVAVKGKKERETIDKGREIRKKEKEMKKYEKRMKKGGGGEKLMKKGGNWKKSRGLKRTKEEKRKGWRNVIGRIVKRGKLRRRRENVLKRKIAEKGKS